MSGPSRAEDLAGGALLLALAGVLWLYLPVERAFFRWRDAR